MSSLALGSGDVIAGLTVNWFPAFVALGFGQYEFLRPPVKTAGASPGAEAV
jgi:hypothetical protein